MIKREDCNGYLSDRLPESSAPWNCNCLPSSDGVDTRTFDYGASSSLNLDMKPSVSCPLSIHSNFHASKQAVGGVNREIHRKAVRNIEEFMPRTKTNLTVAQLLEQAENAKMNRVSPCRSLVAMPKIDSPSEMVTRETMSLLMLCWFQPYGLPAVLHFPRRSAHDASCHCSSSVLQECFVTFCQQPASKGLFELSNVKSASFFSSRFLPLPITSPGYPHNLTESVQKVMQGVGLDTSPPPSPNISVQCRRRQSSMHYSSLEQETVVSVQLDNRSPREKCWSKRSKSQLHLFPMLCRRAMLNHTSTRRFAIRIMLINTLEVCRWIRVLIKSRIQTNVIPMLSILSIQIVRSAKEQTAIQFQTST